MANTVGMVDRWPFWGTAGEMDSPKDTAQEGVCEGSIGIASPMFVGASSVDFAAFAMLLQQQRAQRIEQWVLLRQEAKACRGIAHRATASMLATSLVINLIANAILLSFLRKCHHLQMSLRSGATSSYLVVIVCTQPSADDHGKHAKQGYQDGKPFILCSKA
jgi:hypothetical protein